MPPATLKKFVRKYGIRSVVDLRESIDEKPSAAIEDEGIALAEIGVRHHRLPTPQVPSDETVSRFVEILGDPENIPVLIHCYHGQGRAVLFSALYRIEVEGWDPERAWQATRLVLKGSSFDRDCEKGKYLIEYVPLREQDPESTAGERR
jgi:protein tyrosine/serine phosphatase